MTVLYRWVKTNIILLFNAGSLVGTTAITSSLGFVYWWMAARQFPLESVGIASASISAMMLLGGFCILGLDTLLITELPRQPDQAASLVSTALVVVGSVGIIAGTAFALVSPYLSGGFLPLRTNMLTVSLFAVGVGLTSLSFVLDQALVGLLRGDLQLRRNSFFAVSKLLLLFLIGLWLSGSYKTGMTIYATWASGSAFSCLASVGAIKFKKQWSWRAFLPRWTLIRILGISALQHHMLNMILQAPTLLLPLFVTVLLSAKMNAWFYVSWMIASFVFVIPNALTTVLHAMNSAKPASLGHKIRVTIGIAVATSVIANVLLQVATKQVLGLFGHTYADQAASCLRILTLAAFPLIIKNHYVSICRIHDRIRRAMISMVPGVILELVATVLGARFAGLAGLSLGWLCAICIESLFMLPTLYKIVHTVKDTREMSPPRHCEETTLHEAEAFWLVDTITLPAITSAPLTRSQSIWQANTIMLPTTTSAHSATPTSTTPSISLPQRHVLTRRSELVIHSMLTSVRIMRVNKQAISVSQDTNQIKLVRPSKIILIRDSHYREENTGQLSYRKPLSPEVQTSERKE